MINSKPLRKLSEVVSNKVKRAEVYFTIGHITVYGSFSGEKQDLPKNHCRAARSAFSMLLRWCKRLKAQVVPNTK